MQEHARCFEFFFGLFERRKETFKIISRKNAHIFQPVALKETDICKRRVPGFELFENVVRTSDRRGDRHAVIVEDDEDARVQYAQAVECLIDQPVVEGTVADQRDHIEVLFFQVTRFCDAERGRDRRSRMSGIVTVVFALRTLGKSGDPAAASQGREPVGTIREKFVRVALMPHVEDDFILRKSKDAVQRHGEFHHAEIGSEMSPALLLRFAELNQTSRYFNWKYSSRDNAISLFYAMPLGNAKPVLPCLDSLLDDALYIPLVFFPEVEWLSTGVVTAPVKEEQLEEMMKFLSQLEHSCPYLSPLALQRLRDGLEAIKPQEDNA